MGVKGLWTLLEPAARPVRLESLGHKRLAIDASIWLYQLLKAMTDAEGNPLEDAHIVGFYRRICKLLFYGIKPVFVFDGGAPELKRTTIAERQAMRDIRARDARHTAHQLLQTQLKLHALERNHASPANAQKQGNSPDGSTSPTKKRKRDEYELPPIQRGALSTREENERDLRMAHPDDLRQLVALATKYPESFGGTGDIDTIDIESDAFKSLSPENQHDIIVALKVRSRQTSHNRLQYMLESSKDAMDFSKQQIDLLVKRNTLTQQWLQVTGNAHRITELGQPGANGQVETSGRIAAERNRQYTLIKSDEAGGGWTLKMSSAQSGSQSSNENERVGRKPTARAITLDDSSIGSQESKGSELGDDDDDSVNSVEFEDVSTELSLEHQRLQSDANIMNNNSSITRDSLVGQGHTQIAESLPQGRGLAPQKLVQLNDERNTGIEDDIMSISTSSAASYIDDGSNVDFYPGTEEVYSDYDYGYSQSSQDQYLDHAQDEMRLQREREEQAILAMPAAEFLDVWMRAVPQQVAGYDPAIHDSIRCWLLECDLAGLQNALWRANRRLDKLPDVFDIDNDSDSDTSVDNGQSASAAIYTRELNMLRTKTSYLTFMSNYLSFAVRWRQCRAQASDMPMANQPDYERGVETEDMGIQGSPDIVSVDSESSGESRDMEAMDLKSSSPLASYVQQHADGLDRVTADLKQPNASGDVVDLTNSNASDYNDHHVVKDRAYHDTIFEKARHLGMESVNLDGADKENEIKADTKTRVRNIDSGSEGSADEDKSVLDGGTVDASTASAANGHDFTGMAHGGNEGDDEDDDIDLDITNNERIGLLRDEQNEYARFLDKLKSSAQDSVAAPTLIQTSCSNMRAELQSELEVLRSRVKNSKRDASGVESDMVDDIRMLLTLFGIPYITAPMEAEAQCATLIAKSLVDGMVTDDSDSFLFAPNSARPTLVYRHFFQKDKYVEMYSSGAIYQDSSLTQCDHVFLAYLMGSDYTVGIKGIGPVLAMEALAEFGPNSDKLENNSMNSPRSGGVDRDDEVMDGASDSSKDDEQKVLGSLRRFKCWCDAILDILPGIEIPAELVDTARRRRLAQVIRRSGVAASFPDPRVAHAYFHPQVDRSDAKFEWGFPRLDLLRQFLGEKLGWSVERTDETLVPLARKIVDNAKTEEDRSRQRQTTIESAFSRATPAVAEIVETQRHSKRVGSAISSHKAKGKRKAEAI
ncbi:DNA repair protein rad2 [Coemansia sp. RSA 1813]|nr:DNA repair protein rad2 [Coemansia sp. RSA 1646]KAJ1768936.1 DNA repair protein rad2 [Coemansia sp. RSA 1843]KAJ2212613.1 DNA repair protein rad2 [Coemansia sp. RSA 487]KAJ2567046.1 DNA repair protein rad2 [Coemansia sp. RSA 1813]